MKHSLFRLLLTLSLLLLMVTSSLWASNSFFEDDQASLSFTQTNAQLPLSKEYQKAQLLKQKIDQYPTISYDDKNLENKIYIPTDIMFLIMDHMEPQDFGTFLTISQSSFDLARKYLKERGVTFTKVISSKAGIEAYRKSCLLGSLPHVTLKLYDGKGLPEEANTALHSLAIKNTIFFNKDLRYCSYLSYLTNLHILDINNNNVGEHVTALTGLTNLHTLNLRYNNLDQQVMVIFKSLTNLKKLIK